MNDEPSFDHQLRLLLALSASTSRLRRLKDPEATRCGSSWSNQRSGAVIGSDCHLPEQLPRASAAAEASGQRTYYCYEYCFVAAQTRAFGGACEHSSKHPHAFRHLSCASPPFLHG